MFDGISGTTMDYSAGYYLMGGRSVPLNSETGETVSNGVFKTSVGFGTGVNIGQSKTRRLLW